MLEDLAPKMDEAAADIMPDAAEVSKVRCGDSGGCLFC
jgi:hypothetical protein